MIAAMENVYFVAIRTGSDWLYLAIVLDLFSRKVIGSRVR